MTTHDVAELLKVGEPTVRTWISNKDLRAVKLGREYRVAVRDLEAFVNEHATRPPSWIPDGPVSSSSTASSSSAT